MIVRYKDKEYESEYIAKTNEVIVINGDDEINKIIKDERIQRGLLLGELLMNPYYNLDEAIKNKLL